MLRVNIVRGVGRRFYTVVGGDSLPPGKISFGQEVGVIIK